MSTEIERAVEGAIAPLRAEWMEFQRIQAAVTQRHAEHQNQNTIQSGLALEHSRSADANTKQIQRLIYIGGGSIIMLLLAVVFHIDPSQLVHH